MKYKYIGTEEQLIENGFDKVLGEYSKNFTFFRNNYGRYTFITHDNTILEHRVHIQDLIDKGLVEVIGE